MPDESPVTVYATLTTCPSCGGTGEAPSRMGYWVLWCGRCHGFGVISTPV